LSTEPNQVLKPCHRRIRWRRWLLFKLILVLAVLGGGYWYIANPQRAANLAEGLLGSMTGADVSIKAAHFGLDGTIRLNQIVLRLPRTLHEGGRLFEADRVVIEHNGWSLLLGKFDPHVIEFNTPPTIYLTELADGVLNYERLLQLAAQVPHGPLPATLPEVRLDSGIVKFGHMNGDTYTPDYATRIEGKVTADWKQPALYQFKIVQKDMQDATDVVLQGTYNPGDQTFEAQSETFALRGPHRHWLPPRWRRWWEDMDPQGTMQHLKLGYHHETGEFLAEIGVEDVALNPRNSSLRQAGIAMTGGSGTFRFYNDRIEVDVRGTVGGIKQRVKGVIRGYDANAPLSLQLQTETFMIPEDPRYLAVMPAPIESVFKRFKPGGQVAVSVALERKVADDVLVINGLLSLHGASAVFQPFPYRLREIQGDIRFDLEKVKIVSLNGVGADGAQIHIAGEIRDPGPNHSADILVTGKGVPLGQNLRNAFLRSADRKAFAMFFDKRAYGELVEAGLITGSGAANPNDLASFELGGKVSFSTLIHRDPERDAPTQVTTTVDVAGVNMLYTHWPYPLRIRGGQLVFAPGRTEVRQIVAGGLSRPDSRVAIDGHIEFADGRARPELTLDVQNIPLDKLLRASVKPAQRRWLQDMQIQGLVTATGSVYADDGGAIDFALATKLSDGTARPFHGRYQLESMTGQATISKGGINFDKLSGHHERSRLALHGYSRWQQQGRECELRIIGKMLRFEDMVTDLIPPEDPVAQRVRALIEKYKPTGVYDARLNYKVTPGQPSEYSLEIKPASIEFDLDGKGVALADMTGRVLVTPQRVEIKDVIAYHDKAMIKTTGTVVLADEPSVDLRMDVQDGRYDDLMRRLIPPAVRGVLDGLKLQCDYDLRKARIVYQPDAEDKPFIAFKANVRLRNAECVIGVPVTELNGDLEIDAEHTRGQKHPRIELRLNADQMRVEKRLISPLSLVATNDRDPRILIVDQIRGRCYEGLLIGSAQIEFAEAGRYRIGLLLQDAQIGLFLAAPSNDASATAGREKKSKTRGLLSASLGFEGQRGDVRSRQGRGEAVVRDANLYDGPLSLALLQILNLTFPTASAFDHAETQFVIDGDHVLFDRFIFDAPGVRVAGPGTMQYSTRKLDLDLVTSNPSALDLGPISELLAKLKDELISIHVGGTLTKPDAQLRSFRGAKRSWDTVFGRPRAQISQADRK